MLVRMVRAWQKDRRKQVKRIQECNERRRVGRLIRRWMITCMGERGLKEVDDNVHERKGYD